MHPVGPLPAQEYWRRRLIVLLGLLLVIGLFLWLLFGRGGGDAGAPLPVETPPASASVGQPSTLPESSAPVVPVVPEVSVSPDPEPPTPSGTPASDLPSPDPTASAAIALCADADISVEASSDAATYAQGINPRLTLTVTNTGAVPCQRDIGSAVNELKIVSGSARVWSTNDCKKERVNKLYTLVPKDFWAATVSWPRTTSSPGCPSATNAAGPGTYQVMGTNGGLESSPTVFVLTP